MRASFISTGHTSTQCRHAAHDSAGSPAQRAAFADERGGPLWRMHFYKRVWWPAVERAKIGDMRFHDLRHTSAALVVSTLTCNFFGRKGGFDPRPPRPERVSLGVLTRSFSSRMNCDLRNLFW